MTPPTPHPALLEEVARQASGPVPEGVAPLEGHLRERFGDALSAVLLYGSCLHAGTVEGGIVDVYAVVRDYRAAYPGRALRLLNEVLPPNVFYLEVPSGGATLRAKVAVLSEAHFCAGATEWFHSYVWARFAQPSRLLYARDGEARALVHRALAGAALRFLGETAPAMPPEAAGAAEGVVDAAALWTRGLSLTYASELRPEGAERARWLVERSLPGYEALTRAALPGLEGFLEDAGGERYRPGEGARAPAARRRAARRWALRRWQGKLLSLLRLGKSAFTFAGSADYAAWKIERHTGVAIPVTPFMRRHPFLSAPWALIVLLRRGAMR